MMAPAICALTGPVVASRNYRHLGYMFHIEGPTRSSSKAVVPLGHVEVTSPSEIHVRLHSTCFDPDEMWEVELRSYDVVILPKAQLDPEVFYSGLGYGADRNLETLGCWMRSAKDFAPSVNKKDPQFRTSLYDIKMTYAEMVDDAIEKGWINTWILDASADMLTIAKGFVLVASRQTYQLALCV